MVDWFKKVLKGIKNKITIEFYRLFITLSFVKFYPTLLKPFSDDFKLVKMPTDTGDVITIKFHKEYISYCGYRFGKMYQGKQLVYLSMAELPSSFSQEMLDSAGFSMIVYDFTFFGNDEETFVKILLDSYLDHLFFETDKLKKLS